MMCGRMIFHHLFPDSRRRDERLGEAGDHIGHGAEQARAVRVDHRLHLAHMRLVEGEIDAEQRRSLQRDAAAPVLARLGEHRPADRGLRTDVVDMGADRAGSVRIAAFTSGRGIGSVQATRLTPDGLPLSRVGLSLGIIRR